MNAGFYSAEELAQFNFKSCGTNVLISRKASLYLTERMSFGNNVRIDDFCLLLGNVDFGNYIHIGAYSNIHASAGRVVFEDFSGLSSNCTVYAASDDYSGSVMSNPMVPEKYRTTVASEIIFGKHALVGTGSTVLPGASLPIGVAVGALSLVNKPLDEFGMYVGIPCRKLKERKRDLLELERQLLAEASL